MIKRFNFSIIVLLSFFLVFTALNVNSAQAKEFKELSSSPNIKFSLDNQVKKQNVIVKKLNSLEIQQDLKINKNKSLKIKSFLPKTKSQYISNGLILNTQDPLTAEDPQDLFFSVQLQIKFLFQEYYLQIMTIS